MRTIYISLILSAVMTLYLLFIRRTDIITNTVEYKNNEFMKNVYENEKKITQVFLTNPKNIYATLKESIDSLGAHEITILTNDNPLNNNIHNIHITKDGNVDISHLTDNEIAHKYYEWYNGLYNFNIVKYWTKPSYKGDFGDRSYSIYYVFTPKDARNIDHTLGIVAIGFRFKLRKYSQIRS